MRTLRLLACLLALFALLGYGCPQTSNPPSERTVPDGTSSAKADITKVTTSGSSDNYTFAVTIKSPDTGCDQYADWWEVLAEDGTLLYRRVLFHSHVSEQPFERTGGPVKIKEDQQVWVRAHMNKGGYGGVAFKGSPKSGFTKTDLTPGFAANVATQNPLPQGCDF